MRRIDARFLLCLMLIGSSLASAQSTLSSQSSAVVPRLVNFSGKAIDGGKIITGTAGATFAIYDEESGGSPLWLETQNIQTDANGHYTVQLGASNPEGLPLSLFTSGEARWLGVRVNGGEEQPRILLLSVPYALKAADAETVGGLPASAFQLAGTANAAATQSNIAVAAPSSASASPATSADVTTSGGTVNTLPLFTTTTNVQSSILTQTGSGTTGKIGINTTTPATLLDVNGAATVRGTLGLTATGTATATAGKNSQPLDFTASSYNSSTAAAVVQKFQWQAEPAGNDTTAPTGTMNLLYAAGTATPAETGLKIANNGQITFAPGQAFPTVTGNETVTGDVTASELISTVATGTAPLTVTSTTEVANLNASLLGGKAASAFATLAAANTFAGNQTVKGSLSATGVVTGSSFQIGSNLFAFGSYANENAFLGFAGNTTTTGVNNMAVGPFALYSNTTGNANAASGQWALNSNTTGGYNTASGEEALYSNTTGALNTAVGNAALLLNTTGGNNTAVGAGALQNNTSSNDTAVGFSALYSNTTGSYNDAFGYQALYSNTTGGYNTASGYQALYSTTEAAADDAFGFQALYSNSSGFNNAAFGWEALYSNTTGADNAASGHSVLYSNTTGSNNTGSGAFALSSNTTGNQNTAVGEQALYSNTTGSDLTCIGYSCNSSSDGLTNATAIGAHAVIGQSNSLVLGGTGKYAVKVGIGTTAPSNILTIGRGLGHPVSDSWETYSSRRWKTNIRTLPDALSKVEQLRGVSYDLKASGKHEIGVIAEEVGAVVPEVVSFEENGKDARGVDYSRLTALLIEAVKQQQKQIAAQAGQVRLLRSELKRRTTKEAALESRLEQLEHGRSQAQLASAGPNHLAPVH